MIKGPELIDLRSYNSSLPPQWRQSSAVINAILARQQQFFTSPVAQPNGLVDERIYDWMREHTLPNDPLSFVRVKAQRKWWGRQGRKPDPDVFHNIVMEYYRDPCRPTQVHDIINDQRFIEIFSSLMSEAIDYLRDLPSIIHTPREVYHQLVVERRKKSNTGYRGFSTNMCCDDKIVVPALRTIRPTMLDGVIRHPAISWYREYRQKLRAIFGDSLDNLALYKTYCGFLVNQALFRSPRVAYCSPEESLKNHYAWIARHPNVQTFEGDFESMDQNLTLDVVQTVLSLVMHLANVDPATANDVLQVLQMAYNVPLLQVDGFVREGLHTTFSGMFLTNGPENWVNIAVQARMIQRYCDSENIPTDLRGVYVYAQGDDSYTLVPNGWNIDQLRKCYVVAASEFGIPVSIDKLRASSDYVFFCKRVFPIRRNIINTNLVPIRCLDLAVTGIIYPETGPHTESEFAEVPMMLARLDECVSDPLFVPFLQFLTETYSTRDWVKFMLDPRAVRIQPHTWQEQVYNASSWDASTSPSLRVLRQLNR